MAEQAIGLRQRKQAPVLWREQNALPWSVTTAFELYLVDANSDFRLARRGTLGADGHLAVAELKAPAVALLKLSPLPAQSR